MHNKLIWNSCISMVVLFFCLTQMGYAQRARLYADAYGIKVNETGSALPSGGTVNNPEYSIGQNSLLNNFATLQSGEGGLGLAAQGNARLQLKFLRFSRNLPTNTVVTAKVGNLVAANFGRTAQKDATSSADADGTDVLLPAATMPNNTTVSFTPSAEFNAISLNVTYSGGQRIGYVYNAYIEPYTLPLTLKSPSFIHCGPISVKDLLHFATPDLLKYEIINTSSGLAINTHDTITFSGNYQIKMTDPGSPSDLAKQSATFNVTINPIPEITLSQLYVRVPINTSQSFPMTSCISCNSPIWKDMSGTTLSQIPAKSIIGTTVYTVTMSNGNCSASRQLTVDYYDPNNDCKTTERNYANVSLGQASVTANPAHAIDNDPRTHSVLTSVLLGASQTIAWGSSSNPIQLPLGSTVYVKLGMGAGLLGLLSSLNVQPKLGNADVGNPVLVTGGIIQLLAGKNDLIVSFIVTAPIDRITVSLGGISVGETVNLYGAWYNIPATSCPANDVVDVLSGSAEILKGVLNAASVTVNVQNPYLAIDGDDTTPAVMNSGVGVLAYAKLDVLFSSVSQPGDSVFIKVQSGVETLHLIGGFVIQRYIGDIPVGPPLDFGGTVLSLLKGANGENIIFTVTTEPYDRISIRYGGTANVLGQLLIYDIKRRPYIYTYPNLSSKITLCEGEHFNVGLNRSCLSYEWYENKTGGTPIHISSYRPDLETNTPFVAINTGKKIYYIEHKRNGCRFGLSDRIPFAVDVIPHPGKPHVSITNVIN